ncbi:MAG: hypothetical protein IKD86_04505, partial [Firmicutes bacterium]|nr:hypothetical protein [Bacillota bacterium]
ATGKESRRDQADTAAGRMALEATGKANRRDLANTAVFRAVRWGDLHFLRSVLLYGGFLS